MDNYLIKDVRREIYSWKTDVNEIRALLNEPDDVEKIYILNSITHLNSGEVTPEMIRRLPRLTSIWGIARIVFDNENLLRSWLKSRQSKRLNQLRVFLVNQVDSEEGISGLTDTINNYWTPNKSLQYTSSETDEGFGDWFYEFKWVNGELEITGDQDLVNEVIHLIPPTLIRSLTTYLDSDEDRVLVSSWLPRLTNLERLFFEEGMSLDNIPKSLKTLKMFSHTVSFNLNGYRGQYPWVERVLIYGSVLGKGRIDVKTFRRLFPNLRELKLIDSVQGRELVAIDLLASREK